MIRRISTALPLLLFVLALFPSPLAAKEGDFVVWQAYNVKFEREPERIILLASIYVLNPTNTDYRDLVFSCKAPEGFEIALPPKEIQEASRRPEGFHEELVDGAYQMKQPFLGATQATTIFFNLSWSSPPAEFVQFPGVKIEYHVGDDARTFEALAEENPMSRIRRFSGGLDDYIKHYAGVNIAPGRMQVDWTFTALDYRAFGRNPIGIVDIEGTPEGSGHFRLQSGVPGDFRELLFRWEPMSRGRKDPLTKEFVRGEMETMIRWVGDFSLDPDGLSVEDVKVARYPAVLVSGRWNDNKRNRLGSGLFRMYVVNDPRTNRDMYIYLGVQGRGIGPGAADTPAPEKEKALMDDLLPLVEKFRP